MQTRIALVATLSFTLVLVACATAGAASPVVLGSAAFETHGEGWGRVRPHRFFNGGDPSGLVTEIQWTSWGGESAVGYGLNSIFKPQGGYYGPVLVEIRAYGLGRCSAGGPRAYTRLAVRWPQRPEAPLGPWRAWSEAPDICRPDL